MKITRFTLAAVLWIGLLEAMQAQDTHYVAQGGQTPASPYTSWATAASNIQDAINVSTNGDTVLVSNGVYQTGGVTNYPSGTLLTNRVAITKAITVRSANNNPANTIIKGNFHNGEPGAANTVTNGPAAVRPVYITNGASLVGFTLTNGAIWTNAVSANDRYGGGAYCVSTNAIISNCVITANSADQAGAAYRGNLYNCTLSYNSATNYGGGTYRANLYNCMVVGNSADWGGGVASVANIFDHCTFSGNSAVKNGGGVYGGSLYNCTIVSNSALYSAGVMQPTVMYNCLVANNSAIRSDGGVGNLTDSQLYNCTIVNNSAGITNFYWAGGVENGILYNCIVYSNIAYELPNYKNASFTNSCTFPLPTGSGNITNNPMFVDRNTANYRLSKNSPCINTGTNQSWMIDSSDLDGRNRIRYGIVDMGAYEFIHSGIVNYLY